MMDYKLGCWRSSLHHFNRIWPSLSVRTIQYRRAMRYAVEGTEEAEEISLNMVRCTNIVKLAKQGLLYHTRLYCLMNGEITWAQRGIVRNQRTCRRCFSLQCSFTFSNYPKEFSLAVTVHLPDDSVTFSSNCLCNHNEALNFLLRLPWRWF